MTDRTLITRFVGDNFRSDLSNGFPHWRKVTRAAAQARAQCMDRHAVLVVATWLDEHARPQLQSWLRAGRGPIAVAVGYHPKCDVDSIYGACLRHVLIVADPSFRADTIDIIDLSTPHGFTADGTKGIRRVQSARAQRFGVGSADVLAVLLDPGDDVDRALAYVDGAPRVRRMDDVMRWRRMAEECGVSFERSRVMDAVTQVMGTPTTAGRLRVTPTREELANGFVIGRYDRCSVQTRDSAMSRVHALVVGRGGGLLICDAGSTNGTCVVEGGAPVELHRGARAHVTARHARIIAGGTEVEIDATDCAQAVAS